MIEWASAKVVCERSDPMQFQIQPDSEIPASKQLFDQIRFAIASRQYPPGHRLPSTRQLAMITGLHRNTISKIYQQLEDDGLVESIAGSGIYVKARGHENDNLLGSPLLEQNPEIGRLISQSLAGFLAQGLTLEEIRELLLAEIDWRSQCSSQVLVTIPRHDLGAGELMLRELEQSLKIPVQLVAMEDLAQVLANTKSATVVTSRYFISVAEEIAAPFHLRVIPIDIYDYSKELALIKKLPTDSRLGIVSISTGIIKVAEILIHSLRGDDLLVMSAQIHETDKLRVLARTSQTIISDQASYTLIKNLINEVRSDLIRLPEIICSDNYIGDKSIQLLRRELGLGG
ncbi:Transcriptional regulator [Microcystis aeruginosa PCC 9806]|uniref:GntR family transcriptional regulator n=2 Tax=Microcystis TaxID=1125 RepID=A0A552LA89_9CHRO|nr:GntR family transcriptional regulator [Microcystis aeruginosa]TRV17125.1 MAG: GntR family transcriptional regulator [Microcystis flos-aquae Mf_WU_F_19750830_S460]CCI16685.1 Transcriptional regulator [Microcystis aeruginosa PCC 9806]